VDRISVETSWTEIKWVLYHFASSLIVEQPDYIAVLCRFGLIWYKLLINEWLMPLIMRKLRINQVPSVLSIPYCMYVLPVRASFKVSSTHHPVRSLIHPCSSGYEKSGVDGLWAPKSYVDISLIPVVNFLLKEDKWIHTKYSRRHCQVHPDLYTPRARLLFILWLVESPAFQLQVGNLKEIVISWTGRSQH